MDLSNMVWVHPPKEFNIENGVVTMTTEPHTDLWQRTYYHFRNDNAPVLEMEMDEQYFSFVVKTSFDSAHRYEQCGIAVYLDSDNWIKASIECGEGEFQYLGAVVTNNGYSDWSSAPIRMDEKCMWYRLSRRGSDYKVEYSRDGIEYTQMRICHLFNGAGAIRFGVYACSPEESSFHARFSNMAVTECMWLPHDGQQPDEDID